MDTTTQQRIHLLASVIIKKKQYKYIAVSDQQQQQYIFPYEQLTHEQKEELGDFFSEMWSSGFVLYEFTFSTDESNEKVILSDFEHFDFVFTRPALEGTTFYTQIQNLKELIPADFIQYIPTLTKADIFQA